jgi:hypothetical protein
MRQKIQQNENEIKVDENGKDKLYNKWREMNEMYEKMRGGNEKQLREGENERRVF